MEIEWREERVTQQIGSSFGHCGRVCCQALAALGIRKLQSQPTTTPRMSQAKSTAKLSARINLRAHGRAEC